MRWFGALIKSPKTTALRRWVRDRRAATAIEFALISIPFFGIIVALFEIGLVFLNQTSLERRVDELARMVKIGQAQNSGFQRQQIGEFICSGLFIGGDCQGRLRFEVETLASVDASTGRTSNAIDNTRPIDLGSGGDIVLIRVNLPYDALISVGGFSPISSSSGEPFSFSAATMVRNEPF